MADGEVEFLGLVTRQRDDGAHLLGTELGRSAAAEVVREHLPNLLLEIRLDLGRFGARQSVSTLGEALPPPTNPLSIDTKRARLINAQLLLGRTQDESRSLNESLCLRSGPCQSLDDRPLPA